MKFVALVSGGKDSVYSILECCRLGHELLGCVHLGAPDNLDEESYMYQSAASEALVTLVEECLGVPLVHYRRMGKSLNTSLVYQEASVGDEVEDLFQALTLAQQQFPEVQAVSSGAILSTYQRTRIEHVCSRLQLTSLSFLWRAAPQHNLLDQMIRDGITAVLVRAACPPGLKPNKHLNKTLQELQPLFLQLNHLYQFHVCGEGGEYESLVLDCPLYKKRLVLDETQVVELEGDEGVGVLRILKCHAEEKTGESLPLQPTTTTKVAEEPKKPKPLPLPTSNSDAHKSLVNPLRPRYLPHIKLLSGGLWHVSEIMAPVPAMQTKEGSTEAQLAVHEAQIVLQLLDALLKRHGCTAQDVLFVHLYLSEISHFASINEHYRQFFGTLMPPSRSCVAVGRHVLPGGRRVLLDCMVQCGSGAYLRASRGESPYADAALDNASSRLREVLHVQSISHWAPVCVGPYSQVNTFRSALHFCAGQIGLKPSTMTLHADWEGQLHQCWANVASVLDALEGGSSLEQLLSAVVYVADHVYFDETSEQGEIPAIFQVESICRHQMGRNGGIAAGKVDSPLADQDESDSDGEEQNDQTKVNCPLLVLSIPEMPVGAVVEVEVVAATRKAASCLPRGNVTASFQPRQPSRQPQQSMMSSWDAGYFFSETHAKSDQTPNVQIAVSLSTIGDGCGGVGTITAQIPTAEMPNLNNMNFEAGQVLDDMIDCLGKQLSTEPVSTGLRMSDLFHCRLFYLGATVEEHGKRTVPQDDGIQLRSALQSALASCFSSSGDGGTLLPAISVVPVRAISLIETTGDDAKSTSTSLTENTSIFLALQVLILNPATLESDLWVHHGR